MPSPFPHLALERRGRLDRFAFDADCLAGNPWNDPTRRDVLVYSPHGSRDDTELPVVLFLPAFAGTGEGLLARGLTDVPLTTRLDHLFAGGAPPFRAVFPDTMTRTRRFAVRQLTRDRQLPNLRDRGDSSRGERTICMHLPLGCRWAVERRLRRPLPRHVPPGALRCDRQSRR